MPVIESTQHKLDRVRPPRVQITYDVEVGESIEQVELPFVLGILADLSGSATTRASLKDPSRRFVEIDRDNFNSIMRSIAPKLSGINVESTMPGAHTSESLALDLSFSSIEDFEPTNVISQVEPLRALLEERRRLRDLLGKLDGNEGLHSALLAQIVRATDE